MLHFVSILKSINTFIDGINFYSKNIFIHKFLLLRLIS
jgi:hypothetical protein